MRVVRLFAAGFSVSLRRSLAHRVNLLFDVLLAVAGVLSTLATVAVIYGHTDELAGWTRAQTYVLIGTFEVVSGVKAAFVDPNVNTLPDAIRAGRLDAQLLSPAPSLFLATLGTAAPLAVVQVPLGLAVVFLGAGPVTVPGFAAWLLLTGVATVVMWSVATTLAALAFWAPRLQLHGLYGSAWQLARYPADIYARPVRLLITYVIPLALVATVPAGALCTPPGPPALASAVATAAAAALLAATTWHRGLRRYTGAGS